MKQFVAICLVVCVCSVAAPAQTWELRGAYQSYWPNDRLWENQADGGELKLIHWWDHPGVGVAFSGGYASWRVREQALVETSVRQDIVDGHTSYIPIGLSALVREDMPDYPGLFAYLEAGVWYMLGDTNMQVTRQIDLGGGLTDRETFEMQGEDGMVGRVAAGLELIVFEDRYPTKLLINVGYQFDLVKGKATSDPWLGLEEDLGLNATFVQLGLGIPLR